MSWGRVSRVSARDERRSVHFQFTFTMNGEATWRCGIGVGWGAHQLVEHVAGRLVGAGAAHERRHLRVLDELRLAPRHEPPPGLRLRLAALTHVAHKNLC